jgi:cytidylate kinase
MNVVEAYIKFKGQLIIYISGLTPGSGKTKVSKSISKIFKIKYFDQSSFYKKDYNNSVELPNGKKIINWDSDESIDWDKLNELIDKNKNKGVIISGHALINSKLKHKPDYHIHLSVSKKINLEKRYKKIDKNKDLDKDTIKLVMNQLTFPYYLATLKNSNINKFMKINNVNEETVFNDVFDILINFIQEYLYKDRKFNPLKKKNNIINIDTNESTYSSELSESKENKNNDSINNKSGNDTKTKESNSISSKKKDSIKNNSDSRKHSDSKTKNDSFTNSDSEKYSDSKTKNDSFTNSDSEKYSDSKIKDESFTNSDSEKYSDSKTKNTTEGSNDENEEESYMDLTEEKEEDQIMDNTEEKEEDEIMNNDLDNITEQSYEDSMSRYNNYSINFSVE